MVKKTFYFGYGKCYCKFLKKRLKILKYAKHERPSIKAPNNYPEKARLLK